MNKIGLVTFFDNNFGSSLQCFSTKMFIESLGYKCELLYKSTPFTKWDSVKQKIKKYIQMLQHPSFFFYKLECRRRRHLCNKNPSEQTQMLMRKFVTEVIQPKIVSDSELENKKWLQQYDCFVTGSDQVWNIDVVDVDFYFLTFAPRNKRVALATSFGISKIPSYNQKKIKSLINGFDFISIREETGVKLARQYTSSKIVRLADPTLIYSCTEWRDFFKDVEERYAKKYILVHFLDKPNDVALESLAWLSEQQNLEVLSIGYNYDCLKKMRRFVFMDGDPLKYISLIDGAEYVLTDSFHSTLFSINFEKRFYTFHRQYMFKPQSSRIQDLLRRFELLERLVDDANIVKKSFVNEIPANIKEILFRERLTIRDYIQKSISGQTPQCFLQGESDAT